MTISPSGRPQRRAPHRPRALTPLRPNGAVQHAHADMDRQIATGVDRVAAQLRNATAPAPGFGLLPLLDRAAQLPSAAVHVFSSGATTDDPSAFQRLGFSSDPVVAIENISRAGGLPDLTGHHVTYHGLGVAAGSQPRFQPGERKVIEQFWLLLCQRAGAASCILAEDPTTGEPPMSTLPVPVIPVGTMATLDGCPLLTTFSDADAMLRFEPDSAALPADADTALRPLVEAADRCQVVRIDVTGHVADTGAGDVPETLSVRRARAVADRLVALGLPPAVLGSVSGHGTNEPVIANFQPDGRFDPIKAQQNRRVELRFTRSL